SRPRLASTAPSLLGCSNGAVAMLTVATALCGVRRRTAGSGTPIVTDWGTRAEAAATLTGSVIARARLRSAEAGPTTSTVGGSEVTAPTTYPSRGSPSTAGTTGTIFDADSSNATDKLDGETCTTSTP